MFCDPQFMKGCRLLPLKNLPDNSFPDRSLSLSYNSRYNGTFDNVVLTHRQSRT